MKRKEGKEKAEYNYTDHLDPLFGRKYFINTSVRLLLFWKPIFN
jgi:hypothetical protein